MNHFIIWDLDGTLMDSLTDLMNSTNYALSQCGMPTRSYDEVRQFVGNGVHKLIERAVEIIVLPMMWNAVSPSSSSIIWCIVRITQNPTMAS